MDKKLSKQILWKRSEENITEQSNKPVEKSVDETNAEITENKLVIWLKKADLINRSALCKKSGIDRANLDKYLAKGEIPSQHAHQLISILKKYGYAE